MVLKYVWSTALCWSFTWRQVNSTGGGGRLQVSERMGGWFEGALMLATEQFSQLDVVLADISGFFKRHCNRTESRDPWLKVQQCLCRGYQTHIRCLHTGILPLDAHCAPVNQNTSNTWRKVVWFLRYMCLSPSPAQRFRSSLMSS